MEKNPRSDRSDNSSGMEQSKKVLRWGTIGAVIMMVLFVTTVLTDDARGYRKVDTSVAFAQLDAHNVAEAQIDDREQRVRLKLKEAIDVEKKTGLKEIVADYPARLSPEVFAKVQGAEPEKYTTKVSRDSFLGALLQTMLPVLLLFGLMFFFFTRMQGRGMGMFGVGASRAKELTKDMPTNTFADVAGADEAVDELQEIKDFLQDPARFEALGAKIPRGVLLYGPPGTGKTLLARAVAGEAGVPFYSISGSDFVEMFVGVGASRVRDLFKQAKENSPCIIFVDEIDAVGRQRGSGMGGGHDEREQTLNQLLVEMDGFGDRQGVILIAATNRPDILDPALLRPGRFDRQIPVTNPDLKGREQILKVHAKGKPFAPDVDLNALAKRTAGMSGADLQNVLNEAALLTARVGGNVITADALEEATDRVVGGPRRSSMIISEHEKKVTAYHEGGHTLAAWAMKDIERVYKVTILARGRTGGHAMTAAEDDKGMYNRNELFARIVFAMGGRAAEELVFGAPTTGASSDIEQATKIARAMVTEYGMSPALGPISYNQDSGDPFTGSGGGENFGYSTKVAGTIDEQVSYLVNQAHQVAYEILAERRDYLDQLAYKLLEKETLRRPDLEVLFADMAMREHGEVFPGESSYFAAQAGRTPVDTPVERAIARGEEPPKRFSIVEASRAARAARAKELEARGEAPMATGAANTPAVKDDRNRYAGPAPPADWSAPGWPPANPENTPNSGIPAGSNQPAEPQTVNPYEGDTQIMAAHPGTAQYQQDASPVPAADQVINTYNNGELVGFRLPANEQPEYTEAQARAIEEKTAEHAEQEAREEFEQTGRHAAPVVAEEELKEEAQDSATGEAEVESADDLITRGLDDDPDGTRYPGN